MSDIAIDKIIASILKHDNKINTYKIALIRSINDVVLSYPDMLTHDLDVAIPLHRLARYWVAYYWPFVDSRNPIFQGPRSLRNCIVTNDMSFRPALTQLREAWESLHQDMQSNPADGYLVMDELSVPYKRDRYRKSFPKLVQAYDNAITAISKAIEQPTRYAGTNIVCDQSPDDDQSVVSSSRQHTTTSPAGAVHRDTLVVSALAYIEDCTTHTCSTGYLCGSCLL
jgi:hypothetical protein